MLINVRCKGSECDVCFDLVYQQNIHHACRFPNQLICDVESPFKGLTGVLFTTISKGNHSEYVGNSPVHWNGVLEL